MKLIPNKFTHPKHLSHILKPSMKAQQWVYRGISSYFSKHEQFDRLEFNATLTDFVVKDYNAFRALQGGVHNEAEYIYKFYGQLMEGHIDYWFPLDKVHNCTVFSGYKNCIEYPGNILSLGFDYFDFYVHRIFSDPMLFNEINRLSIQQAEHDVVIPTGMLRPHRQLFLECLANDRRALSIITDRLQDVLPTDLRFDSMNMEIYLNKCGSENTQFKSHQSHVSFYEPGPMDLMQLPHKKMHAQARVNIALETTVYNTEYPYLTEKTFKILANNRPFVILGDRGLLHKLKQKGFKTFDNYCDESYDQETDLTVKINQAVAATHQLVAASKSHADEIDAICRFNQARYFETQRLHDELADFGQLCMENIFNKGQ
jgi:hypothetical protein